MNSEEYEAEYQSLLERILAVPNCDYKDRKKLERAVASIIETNEYIRNNSGVSIYLKSSDDNLSGDKMTIAMGILKDQTRLQGVEGSPLERAKHITPSLFKLAEIWETPAEKRLREREEEAQRLSELAEFTAYDSLEEIVKEWPQSTSAFSEVKFVKPGNLAGWQSTIYRCATMVKVFKTLDQHMAANKHKYHFIYQCKTLFRSTTHVFEYDAQNFAFVIRTGLGSGGQIFKNTPVPFYKQVRDQLQTLLDEMKKELPQKHYEQVFSLYILIKDKLRA